MKIHVFVQENFLSVYAAGNQKVLWLQENRSYRMRKNWNIINGQKVPSFVYLKEGVNSRKHKALEASRTQIKRQEESIWQTEVIAEVTITDGQADMVTLTEIPFENRRLALCRRGQKQKDSRNAEKRQVQEQNATVHAHCR